jgi:hypothetical protein
MADFVEMTDGDFVAIGKMPVPDVKLLHSAIVQDDEYAVVVPRAFVIHAAREILRNEDIN